MFSDKLFKWLMLIVDGVNRRALLHGSVGTAASATVVANAHGVAAIASSSSSGHKAPWRGPAGRAAASRARVPCWSGPRSHRQ